MLRGILVYVFCLGSFRQLGSWATSIGLSQSGERAWAKRTRQAASWLLWLVQTLLAPSESDQPRLGPEGFAGRIHLVDATHLRTWSRSGESRRLHSSYDLLAGRLEQVLLTDHPTGEGVRHFRFAPGDIVVADSAYCRRQAILEQLDAGVQVLIRLHWSSTPLLCEDGQTPFDLSRWLRHAQASGEDEAKVVIQVHKRQQSLRLLVVRLSPDVAKRAHSRRKTHARKNGRTNQDLTIQLADWLVVLTSLPSAKPDL